MTVGSRNIVDHERLHIDEIRTLSYIQDNGNSAYDTPFWMEIDIEI